MKTPITIALVALASLTATAASAYHFNPPDASVHLHGKMTFTPNGGQPFTCTVTMELKTKRSHITAIRFPQGACNIHFGGAPWGVDITGANSGKIFINGFVSGNGDCSQGWTTFQDNGSGIWTFPTGQCLSGTLNSNPPTTIVQ